MYPIQSHPQYLFCVGHSADEQLLIGIIKQRFLMLLFDREGNLRSEKATFIPPDLLRHVSAFEKSTKALEELAMKYRTDHEMRDECIYVKRFFLNKYHVGITDLPEDLIEQLDSPASAATLMEDDLEDWKEDDLYVLWWNQSLWVDDEGVVETS